MGLSWNERCCCSLAAVLSMEQDVVIGDSEIRSLMEAGRNLTMTESGELERAVLVGAAYSPNFKLKGLDGYVLKASIDLLVSASWKWMTFASRVTLGDASPSSLQMTKLLEGHLPRKFRPPANGGLFARAVSFPNKALRRWSKPEAGLAVSSPSLSTQPQLSLAFPTSKSFREDRIRNTA